MKNAQAVTFYKQSSTCNCISFKDCELIKTLSPHNTQYHRSYFTNEECQSGHGDEVFVCCPARNTLSSVENVLLAEDPLKRTEHTAFRAAYEDNSSKDIWVWDRTPNQRLIPKEKFNTDYNLYSNVLDYKDPTTQYNCPHPFLDEDYQFRHTEHFHNNHRHQHDNSFSDFRNKFSQDNDDSRFIYPDDKILHKSIIFPTSTEVKSVTTQRPVHGIQITNNDNQHHVKIGRGRGRKVSRTNKKINTESSTNNSRSRENPVQSKTSINSPQCGSLIEMRIIGGLETKPGQYLWLVRLAYLNITDNSVNYRCLGSLISRTHVLTAAHCVNNLVRDLKLSYVRIGEEQLPAECRLNANNCNSPNILQIEQVIIHPKYDEPKYANDIAILKVRIPANMPVEFGTICLPLDNTLSVDNDQIIIGTTGIVVGWSSNNEDGITNEGNSTLKQLRLPIINTTECAINYAKYTENFENPIVITPAQICAQGEPHNDVCRGDSGGPFMMEINRRLTIMGIVAFGPRICGITNFPGVYTRVSSYISWIIQQMA
ncbi:phenoloxidase-activating enzyme-like [Teleopsis dalmanni]|uniref:phenoloxidase-activating enzyme-like n=1 Tax=Teleopsis dalmanni TaxID=139649 RepID=UPI0018CD864F|nr:phenoloxidase-activating enzyme-like [Teleopsis dalmanni]